MNTRKRNIGQMESFYRVVPWMFLLFTTIAAEEFLIYDADLDSNRTEMNSSEASDTTTVNCVRDHLYDKLDIQEVLGKWKVRQLYMHLSKEGVNEYTSCPEVNIWEEPHIPTSAIGVGLMLFDMQIGRMRHRLVL